VLARPVPLLVALSLAACTAPEPGRVGAASGALLGLSASLTLGPDEVGLRPAMPERLAEGPSSLAFSQDGSLLLLDRLNGRVLRLRATSHEVAARVPEDSEEIAAGPDGAFAVFSPLRSRVWVHAPDGAPAGELEVPRALPGVRAIALGSSREVRVVTMHQETYRLGSPSFPQLLAAVLNSRREGETGGEEPGLAVRLLPDGSVELELHARGEHAPVVARHRVEGPVSAARLVGRVGQAACLRLEAARQAPGGALVVERRVRCLDLASGKTLLDRDLPAPGSYVPRRELALGGAPPRLALLSASSSSLRIEVWPLEGESPRKEGAR
jgi:hypothetical protein